MMHTTSNREAPRPAPTGFPIQREVRYRSLGRGSMAEMAEGTTVSMSSHAVEFTTPRALRLGQRVELNVNWPALLDRTCPLKLVIFGHVIGNNAGTAEIQVDRYEFRTRGAAATAA